MDTKPDTQMHRYTSPWTDLYASQMERESMTNSAEAMSQHEEEEVWPTYDALESVYNRDENPMTTPKRV